MKLLTTSVIGMLAFASIASAEKSEKKDIVDIFERNTNSVTYSMQFEGPQ